MREKRKKPPKPSYYGPQIEFRDNKQVVVDGCKRIIEYEPETIKLHVGGYNIRINGSELALKTLSEKTVMIEGNIMGLEFHC